MGDLVSKPKPVEEVMKDNKRAIQKAIRELDNVIRQLQSSEKKEKAEAKKMGKKNEQVLIRIHIKQVMKTRKNIERFIVMKSQLNAVGLKMQTMHSHQALTKAMSGVYSCMQQMNLQSSVPEFQNIMKQFAKENEISEVNQERLNDMMDDTLGEEDTEIEEDDLYRQIMAEIGLDLAESCPEALNSTTTAMNSLSEVPAIPTTAGGLPPGKKPPGGDDDNGGGPYIADPRANVGYPNTGDNGGNGGGGNNLNLAEVQARIDNLRR